MAHSPFDDNEFLKATMSVPAGRPYTHIRSRMLYFMRVGHDHQRTTGRRNLHLLAMLVPQKNVIIRLTSMFLCAIFSIKPFEGSQP